MMNNFELDSHGSNLTLIAKGKQPYRGKLWDKSKGKFHAKQQGMTHSDVYDKRNITCYYCGKPGHFAKDCFKRKNHESKQGYKRHNGNFMRKDTSVNEGFKNLKLFIFEAALCVETDDENAWFIDSRASIHMTCNKEWSDEYYDNVDGTTFT